VVAPASGRKEKEGKEIKRNKGKEEMEGYRKK